MCLVEWTSPQRRFSHDSATKESAGEGIDGWLAFTSLPALLSGMFCTLPGPPNESGYNNGDADLSLARSAGPDSSNIRMICRWPAR